MNAMNNNVMVSMATERLMQSLIWDNTANGRGAYRRD